MTEHTPTPWIAASKYSSMVGVPIVNQQGKRIGNTAMPDMPPEWDHLKRQAEIDAAFIVKAVNSHDALMKALKAATGFLMNAKIDLSTGCTKATAIRTIEGGIKLAQDALAAVSSPVNRESASE